MTKICGVCGAKVRLFDVYTILVPDGDSFMRFDNRPKTPTGGRFGVGGGGIRRFQKMKKVPSCAGCALTRTIVDWPGKLKFEDRCKSGRR